MKSILGLALVVGLVACKPKAAELAGDVYPVASATGEKWEIDTGNSVIRWTGKKVSGSHNGTVKLKSGFLTAKGDNITSGSFVIDFASIEDDDLKGTPFQAKLEEHLKSPDFFDVVKNPNGTFELASVTTNEQGKTEVRGNLTIKGISKGINFPIEITYENGKPVGATGTIEINRQQWEIKYPGMPDDLIQDIITLDLNLKTKV